MLATEKSAGHNRHSRYDSSSRNKSGYEPSDTETEWHESPWNDAVLTTSHRTRPPKDPSRNPHDGGRKHSVSPYNRRREGQNASNLRNNRSPLKVAEQRRHTSPYNGLKNESRKSHRTPPKFQSAMESFSRGSITEKISRSRSTSTPKLRTRDKQHSAKVPAFPGTNHVSTRTAKNMEPNMRENAYPGDCSQDEINEMIVNGKGPKSPSYDAYACTSTDSIPTGDIFFSRDCAAPLEKPSLKLSNVDETITEKPNVHPENDGAVPQENSSSLGQAPQIVSMSTVLSQTNTNSSCTASRLSPTSSSTTSSNQLNSGRFSGDSGKFSDFTGKLVGGVMKFSSNMHKAQNDTWLTCVTGNSCRKSRSPNCKPIDEANFIEKAFIVEKIRLFWADKHRPQTLNGFICHRQQVQQLKQLVSPEVCPHIIFKGPSGSGKRSLCRALLVEIFGDSSLNVSHYLKRCDVQAPVSVPILVPLASSPHHVELTLRSQSKNARYILMALVNEMANKHKTTDPVARKNFKVIVLYNVDKASENNQHLIKWMIDCYSDACKIIICCEDESNLLDSIRSRCKLISVDAPDTCEIVDVLIHISKKEDFDLPASFAASIAMRSRQNLREAILALEACKANNYPFVDGQAIPLGWEDVLEDLAAEILADPSPKRLFLVRGKFQKLLVEFVHPKLILQKLVDQFLKGTDASIRREVYYWHAYYDKRLPIGASALLKLEEFVAKFMSIHRKNLSLLQHS